jgi:hypothetical protein
VPAEKAGDELDISVVGVGVGHVDGSHCEGVDAKGASKEKGEPRKRELACALHVLKCRAIFYATGLQ